MKFTKMHGAGNDYIYISCLNGTIENPSALARKLSDRHFGIGADGLILICPSQIADFAMKMYNADGSEGKMCGNAIRCVGKYVYDRGLTSKRDISIETASGIKHLEMAERDGKIFLVRVDMGAPEFRTEKIPALFQGERVISQPLCVAGKTYPVTCVSMGNPHCVVFLDEDVRKLDLSQIGPAFENHSSFPDRINTEFVNILERDVLRVRVWERGSGETLACGTGACACVAAAALNGYLNDSASVELPGGDLLIDWDREENTVYMTGSAVWVFDGEI